MKILTQNRFAMVVLCLLGLAGAFAVRAADMPIDSSNCREVTKQAVVWPKASHPGKNTQVAKVESRRLTVCEMDRTNNDPALAAKHAL
jgi:hypothetical protein